MFDTQLINPMQRLILRHLTIKTVKTPSLADSITEGTLSIWHKNIGEFVSRDSIIATLETDKVDVVVNSSVSGVVTNLYAKVGDTVVVGADLYSVDVDGAPSTLSGGAAAAPSTPAPAAAPSKPTSSTPAPPTAPTPTLNHPKPVQKLQPTPSPPPPLKAPATTTVGSKITESDEIPGLVPTENRSTHTVSPSNLVKTIKNAFKNIIPIKRIPKHSCKSNNIQ